MFKAISVFSVVIMLAGCQITTERFMSNNRSKLINLKMGMSKNQVLNLMGNDSGSLTGTVGLSVGSVFITNPYKSELHHSSGETYEVLFYYTDDKNDSYRIDWISGIKELILSASEANATESEILEMHPSSFDGYLLFLNYSLIPIDNKSYSFDKFVNSRYTYNVKNKELAELLFDNKDLQFVAIVGELNDGFIVGFTTIQNPTYQYAYILKEDYFAGKSNFINVR